MEAIQSIKATIMRRDGMSEAEADELIQEAKDQLQEYLANGDTHYAWHICAEYFGLEPDYIFDLM